MPKSPVSVVQLATGHVGGAGLAARRLHHQLLSDGVNSDFYCLERLSFSPGSNEYSIKRNLGRKLISKLAIIANEKLTKQIHFSVFSTNGASLRFFKGLSKDKTRVLHFHNWQNLISQKSLLTLISEGYPIVLTLHDERISTGGCHYRLECVENYSGCRSCPRASKLLYPKIRHNRESQFFALHKDVPNLVLISPSKWLRDSVLESLNVSRDKIVNIFNPLGPEWDAEIFKCRIKDKSESKTKVGIATMSDSFVKRGELLQELVNDPLFVKDYEIVYLRDFPELESGLSNFWKEIDILMSLSRADNSPNSIAEARSLGIPVLASRVGGIPELLGKYDIALEDDEHNVSDILSKLSVVRSFRTREPKQIPGLENSKSDAFLKLYESLLGNS